MKGYFLFIFLIVGVSTGYIFFNRPGNLSFDVFTQSGNLLGSTKKEKKQSSGQTDPLITYVTGNVLINADQMSYLAEHRQPIRINDEILSITDSFLVLKLGKDQYLKVAEGSRLKFLKWPRRNRGFFEFELLQGRLFVDFFKGKHPTGIRVHVPHGHVSSQDATFRVTTFESEDRAAVDRGTVSVVNTGNGDFASLNPGYGAKISKGLESNVFPWVDQYQWDKSIQDVLLLGQGIEATFKATPLSDRPSPQKLAEKAPKVRRRRRRPAQKQGSSTFSNIMNKVKNQASKAVKNLPSPSKVQETAETIQNFEKIQQDRAKALENIEE